MKMNIKSLKVTAVIRNSISLSLAEDVRAQQNGESLFLTEMMAQRLAAINSVKNTFFLLSQERKSPPPISQNISWTIIDKSQSWLRNLIKMVRMVKQPYICFFDFQYPFIDSGETEDLIEEIFSKSLLALHVKKGGQFVPSLIIHRKLLPGILFKKLFFKKNFSWEHLKQRIPHSRYKEISLSTPELTECLRSDFFTKENVDILQKNATSRKALLQFEQENPDKKNKIQHAVRDALHQTMLHSAQPHQWNFILNQFESRHRFEQVKSFPLDVAFNITNRCNAHCAFCSYQPGKEKMNDLTLEDFKKMNWLKYVWKVGLGGDIGDPLVNPEFSAIYNYLRETYPHQYLRVITNGIALSECLCRLFAGSLAKIRVSLNASQPQTWRKLVRAKGFERIVENIGLLAELKKQLNTPRPYILLMMVICKENIEEVVDFVKLAHSIGANEVVFRHFNISIMPNCDLPASSSMYYDHKNSDDWLVHAEKCANDLGIKIDKPVPFHERKYEYFEGERVKKSPEKCLAPWQTCYLTGKNVLKNMRKMEFCCSGFGGKIEYTPEDFDADNFSKVWNHKSVRYFRKTVNLPQTNPYCQFCCSQDRINPENQEFYRLKAEFEQKTD